MLKSFWALGECIMIVNVTCLILLEGHHVRFHNHPQTCTMDFVHMQRVEHLSETTEKVNALEHEIT